MFTDDKGYSCRGNPPLDGVPDYDICCKTPDGAGYGMAHHAVDEVQVDKDDGTMWVSNGEYETQVNFCPFCGKKALVQIGEGIG